MHVVQVGNSVYFSCAVVREDFRSSSISLAGLSWDTSDLLKALCYLRLRSATYEEHVSPGDITLFFAFVTVWSIVNKAMHGILGFPDLSLWVCSSSLSESDDNAWPLWKESSLRKQLDIWVNRYRGGLLRPRRATGGGSHWPLWYRLARRSPLRRSFARAAGHVAFVCEFKEVFGWIEKSILERVCTRDSYLKVCLRGSCARSCWFRCQWAVGWQTVYSVTAEWLWWQDHRPSDERDG